MFGLSAKATIDILISTKDEAFRVSLGAIGQAHEQVLEAKQIEVEALKRMLADLGEQIRYERARADSLVDRLLVRDAHVAAVSPVAIAAAKMRDEETVKRLRETFEQMNDVGVAPASVAEARAFELAGGSAVATHV